MLNYVALIGRLTTNLKENLRELDEGLTTSQFSIAVETGKEETSFIRCVAFNNTAKLLAEHTSKGDRIAIGGSLRQRKYTDATGVNREVVEVIVRDIQFVEPKPQNEESEEEDEEVIPEVYYKDKDGDLIKKSNAKKSNANKSK